VKEKSTRRGATVTPDLVTERKLAECKIIAAWKSINWLASSPSKSIRSRQSYRRLSDSSVGDSFAERPCP